MTCVLFRVCDPVKKHKDIHTHILLIENSIRMYNLEVVIFRKKR